MEDSTEKDNPTTADAEPIEKELRALVAGVRSEVQALREELTALRRRESPEGPDALLTREEAADRLQISVRKLDRLREAGRIQAVQIDRAVRYHPKTLDRFVRRRTGGGNGR
jgi:excisionase family DNA binding protein